MALSIQVVISAADRITGPLEDISNRMEGFRRAGAWMTATGAAINGTLFGAAAAAAKFGSEMWDMSSRTGVSTVALSKFKYAAEQTGASLPDVETGLKRMARVALDASRGLKAPTATLEALGVTATLANGKLKSSEKLFVEIGTALRNVKNETERAALAQEVFGRGGMRLLPMFTDSEKSISEYADEAKRLGLVLDDDAAAGADELDDALQRLKATGGMAFLQLGLLVAPTAQKIVDALQGAATAAANFSREHPTLATGAVGVAIALGMVFSVLGPILYLLPNVVAGWRLLAGSQLAVRAAALEARVALWLSGTAAKSSGLAAMQSAERWSLLQARLAAIGKVAGPIIVVYTLLANAVKRFNELGESGAGMWERWQRTLSELVDPLNQVYVLIKNLVGLFGVNTDKWAPSFGTNDIVDRGFGIGGSSEKTRVVNTDVYLDGERIGQNRQVQRNMDARSQRTTLDGVRTARYGYAATD